MSSNNSEANMKYFIFIIHTRNERCQTNTKNKTFEKTATQIETFDSNNQALSP